MKSKIQILSLILIFSSLNLLSQSGGNSAYEFLNLTNSSRQAALGGNLLSINDDDISLILANPALINENIDNNLLLNFVDYFSDINFGFVSYAKKFGEYGTFASSMQYVNYGKFTEADETGEILGNFSAAEYALTIGWAKKLSERFTLGANIKGIHSTLYNYNSTALAFDVATNYYNPDKEISATLLFRNVGRPITTYVAGVVEPMPFEIQIAASKKLEHVPLRFHVLLHNLQKYDITYTDSNSFYKVDPFTGQPIERSKISDVSNKLMHHIAIGAELNPSKNVFFRFGYNYHRRKEMIVESRLSTIGFSWGVGLRISKFNISYARSAYHLAGSPNVITLTTNLSDFIDNK